MSEKLRRVFMKKVLSILLAAVMAGSLVGCGAGGAASQKKTEVSVLIGKPEIAKQFEETVSEFNKESKDAKVKIIPLGDQNAYEKFTSLYASGNVPQIMEMSQEFGTFKDKLLDMTNQPWVKHAMKGTLDYVTVNNKVYGMPMTVESFGFIYNKKVLDKAVGGTFDPSTIKTQNDLSALFEKIQKVTGKGAVTISPMDWSLGAHFTNVMFTDQSNDTTKRHQFIDDLKAGKVSLKDNAVFKGWLDTFDLMKKYNSDKASPLSPQYDAGPVELGKGQVGMWFMGNWALPQIKEADPSGEYGFLPVPISNNADDYGNSQISVGVPLYWVVDASKSTPEQKKASEEFLNWMVSNKTGEDYYVNKCGFIPVFDNVSVKPKEALSQNVLKYMKNGKTLEWMNNYYPADGFPSMGASLQKYLAGKTDRNGLAQEFENYWKKAK